VSAFPDQARKTLLVASLLSFAAVLLGAFGGHGLADRLQELGRVDTYQTANQYHFYHALALFGLGLLMKTGTEMQRVVLAAKLMAAGVLVFSGSLYVLAVTDLKLMGMITPIGGMLLLASWFMMIVELIGKNHDQPKSIK